MTIDLDALAMLADEAEESGGDWECSSEAGSSFIAAANPATIKALVAELRDARSTIEELLYAHTDKSIAMGEAFLARNGKGEG